IRAENDKAVSLLLQFGADVKLLLDVKSPFEQDKISALHLAAFLGQSSITERLLRANASVDPLDSRGHTPLFTAAHGNHISTITPLLNHGADIEGKPKNILTRSEMVNDPTQDPPLTPLQVAVMRGHLEASALLLAQGADYRIHAPYQPSVKTIQLAKDPR